MHAAPNPPPASAAGELAPAHTLNQELCDDICQSAEPVRVSQDRLVHISGPRMTADEREAAIARAAAAEARHDTQWMLTGCFAAKGDADRAKRLKQLLIAGRSPSQVKEG